MFADTLQCFCSGAHDEVKRNSSYAKGSRKEQVVEELPEDVWKAQQMALCL